MYVMTATNAETTVRRCLQQNFVLTPPTRNSGYLSHKKQYHKQGGFIHHFLSLYLCILIDENGGNSRCCVGVGNRSITHAFRYLSALLPYRAASTPGNRSILSKRAASTVPAEIEPTFLFSHLTSACLRKEHTNCCVPGFRSCFFTT